MLDAVKIHEFVCEVIVNVFLSNRLRFDVRVALKLAIAITQLTSQLRRSEIENQEVIVIQRPHAVRSGWLHHIHRL